MNIAGRQPPAVLTSRMSATVRSLGITLLYMAADAGRGAAQLTGVEVLLRLLEVSIAVSNFGELLEPLARPGFVAHALVAFGQAEEQLAGGVSGELVEGRGLDAVDLLVVGEAGLEQFLAVVPGNAMAGGEQSGAARDQDGDV